jgi:radical SAM superfamily enzyme YgiQ (UPF0313 family)
MKTVAVIELNILERMVPLVGGYLESYAMKDPGLRQDYRFLKIAESVHTDRSHLVQRFVSTDADVYAFSCYVWNSGLVRWVASQVRQHKPSAWIMLGGPQVMHRADRYLSCDDTMTSICNGEGEITFAAYLRELTELRPNLARVHGITYVEDGQRVTTKDAERVKALEDIPSPFLEELFEGQYTLSVLETTRGCPFRCGFCYWGAATNDRVYKFSEERIREEITWLGKKRVIYLFLADANWGMLNRDVELTKHIASCSEQYHAPRQLYFCAAKNSPDRVFEIAKICRSADIITAQTVSLQSLSDDALRMVDRQNIKTSAYIKLQAQLEQLKIAAVTELIWPLPGETLSSFKQGIEDVCRGSNGEVIVYPHLLLANTPLDKNREAFGLETESTCDDINEVERVIGTKTVSPEACEEGLRYFYAVHLLHNAHGLRHLTRYLDQSGVQRYQTVFTQFATFIQTKAGSRIVDYINESCRSQIAAEPWPYGSVIHYALHEFRNEFTDMLFEFVSSREYWSDEAVQLIYELDQVCLPYVYGTTPLDTNIRTSLLSVAGAGRHYIVDVPERFIDRASDALFDGANGRRPYRYRIDHDRGQFPFNCARSMMHNASYCQEIVRTGSAVSTCSPIEWPDHIEESAPVGVA